MGAGADSIEIVQGSVHKAVGVLATFNRRYERKGSGRQHQLVIAIFTLWCGNDAPVTIQCGDRLIQPQFNTLRGIPVCGAHSEICVGGAGEILRQMYPIIGQLFFLPENKYLVLSGPGAGDELLQEVMANHAVANHD